MSLETLYVVAGLGNPGADYAQTRHNVGFAVIDALYGCLPAAQRQPRPKLQLQTLLERVTLAGQRVLLCKPQSFMNDSGRPLAALSRYYKVPLERFIVVHDELDFDLGTVRLKQGGGHGGHNGIRSILSSFGVTPSDNALLRVRVGIGKPPPAMPGAAYVLARFPRQAAPQLAHAVTQAVQAVCATLTYGVARAQAQLHTTQG